MIRLSESQDKSTVLQELSLARVLVVFVVAEEGLCRRLRLGSLQRIDLGIGIVESLIGLLDLGLVGGNDLVVSRIGRRHVCGL